MNDNRFLSIIWYVVISTYSNGFSCSLEQSRICIHIRNRPLCFGKRSFLRRQELSRWERRRIRRYLQQQKTDRYWPISSYNEQWGRSVIQNEYLPTHDLPFLPITSLYPTSHVQKWVVLPVPQHRPFFLAHPPPFIRHGSGMKSNF